MFQTFKSKAKYAALVPMLAIGNAMAALPAEVNTAMSDAKTDAVSLAMLGLLIVIAIAAVKYIRRGV